LLQRKVSQGTTILEQEWGKWRKAPIGIYNDQPLVFAKAYRVDLMNPVSAVAANRWNPSSKPPRTLGKLDWRETDFPAATSIHYT
jgi:hypothetical protein